MKQRMEDLFAKIDALGLRERVFLMLSIIACCLALVDAAWLSPAREANKKLVQQFAAQSSELVRLRDELKIVSQPVDPAVAVRADIALANRRMDVLNQEVDSLLPQSQNGPALEQVLVQFLKKYEGLTLLGLRTLGTQAAVAVAAPGSAATPGLLTGLTKKGMELRVSGPYAELVRYLQALETALPSLRWGSMVLKSEAQPPVLTLQVFVLGVQQ
jgi:MSHA biogenesis protein MshJ